MVLWSYGPMVLWSDGPISYICNIDNINQLITLSVITLRDLYLMHISQTESLTLKIDWAPLTETTVNGVN